MLVQTIAGPLAGDRVTIDVEIGPGAALELVGNAATLAYPSAEPAHHEVRVRVGAGGRFAWAPEPLILATDCDLEASVELELAAGAAAFTRELVVLGRHGEKPGSYRSSLRCELDGTPLLHDAVEIDDGGSAASSAAVLAGAKAFASLALLGVETQERLDAEELTLAGPGTVLRALAPDAASLRKRLAPAESTYLGALAAHGPKRSASGSRVARGSCG